MPVSPLWSFLFFMMLITLGLDSQFTSTETLITAMMDEFPALRNKKGTVVITVSAVGFLLGLPLCCNGGILLFTLIDWFCASWSLLLIAIMEVLFLTYVYGHTRLFENISEMGIKIPKFAKYYWRFNWQLATPLILIFIIIITFVKFSPAEYNDYVFPAPIQFMGWLMACVSILVVLGGAAFEFYRRRRDGLATDWKTMLSPVPEWGPAVRRTIDPITTQNQMAMEAAYTNEAFSNNNPGNKN
jgi:solute carrier family 6 amino acid transporter-like protein 5/7/9/14